MLLCMIDALAPQSNNILIVYTSEFLFSSKVTWLIWEYVKFIPRGFGVKITPKVISDKSDTINIFAHYLKLIYFKVDLQHEIK